MLDNLSFNFTYKTVIDFLNKSPGNFFQDKIKKILEEYTKISIKYHFYMVMPNDFYDIEKLLKIIKDNKDKFIRYNSVIDIDPIFYKNLFGNFIDKDKKFLNYYQELTKTIYKETLIEKLVYDIKGGSIKNYKITNVKSKV